MDISVILPTLNAGKLGKNLFQCLKSQTADIKEFLVIDSGSSDDTTTIAESFGAKVFRINAKDFDHGTTRNFGAAQTSGDILVFLTQDTIPADEYMIEELIKPLQADPNIAICYGRQIPYPDASPLEVFVREFNYPDKSLLKTKNDIEKLGLKTFFCSNSCAAYRRSIFEKLGGFKEKVITNEDMLFAAQAIFAGYSVYYAAEAKVYHSHAYSMRQTLKRYFNIGRFFADNRWILENVGLKNYGGGMLTAGIKTFWVKRMPRYIVALVIEFAVKASACTIGKCYQRLLHLFCR